MSDAYQDLGWAYRKKCTGCGALLCAKDIPIEGKRGRVIPANAVYRPGIPTDYCTRCEGGRDA